ncbi:MAG: hypothetical protein Q8J96_11695 [Rhodocyclaceae bacterium]|nr:hypothetical protein [Rhodocyclaceae bacterium]MDP3032332.1 hypothetical protein [Rhodocyclaceae bacterium]
MLRRLRRRFGITAPQVSVRTHVPLYLRLISIVVLTAVSLALAGWVYDTGRRMAGFDQSEAGSLVKELRQTNAALEEEAARLRSLLTASQSSLQIDQAAQESLSEKNKALVSENARLQEELAVFERLTKLVGKADDEVSLDRVTVRADGAPGRYRFSFLIALQGAKRGKETKFSLQVVATPRAPTASAKISFPRHDDPDAAQYEFLLRNFKRVEGKFEVPATFSVGAVEIRILESGVLKASKSLTL